MKIVERLPYRTSIISIRIVQLVDPTVQKHSLRPRGNLGKEFDLQIVSERAPGLKAFRYLSKIFLRYSMLVNI